MNTYTKYEQAYGEGDVVDFEGLKYIVRECIQEEDDSWSYFIEAAGAYSPSFAEVPQDDLKEYEYPPTTVDLAREAAYAEVMD